MLYAILILALQFSIHADECRPIVRAVFDVGSGSTKLNLSQIETCPGGTRVLRVLDDRTSLDVPLEANRQPDGSIGDKGVQLQVDALKKLKAAAIARAR